MEPKKRASKATKPKPRKPSATAPKPPKVATDSAAWKAALAIARGDASRLVVRSATEVTIRNRPVE